MGIEYPTKPLEYLGRFKELRRSLAKRSWEAKERGGVVVVAQGLCHPLVAGLGPVGRRHYAPYFGKAVKDTSLLIHYHEVADSAGFLRGEMCSAMHHFIGEVLLGLTTKNPVTGAECPADFVLEMEFCPSPAKMAQFAAELLGIPCLVLDVPQLHDEDAVEYLAGQMLDAIDWMVKVTGKEYRDDLMVTAVENWWEQGVLWARLSELNKAIPAPLDSEMLADLAMPRMVAGDDPELTDFYRMVLSEVKDRVAQGISAWGVEARRLSHEGEHMYYAKEFVPEICRRYGAVFVGGNVAFDAGIWDIDPEGRWTSPLTLAEMGIDLHHREQAARILAEAHVKHLGQFRNQRAWEKVGELLYRALDWKCDGAVLHLDMGCHNQSAVRVEASRVLEEAGIPTLTYYSSNGDVRDFSPQVVADRLESFMERLGLRPLGEAVKGLKGERI